MNISMFDILGPIMIGPSSSHTAGAQRIGKAMYNMIADKQLVAVHFILHGSFHLTLHGHGTDRALVGGVLGMNAYDPQIKDSLQIAKERGIEVSFEGADLGDVHPNTVQVIAQTSDGKTTSLIGSSIGGANIEIIEINGTPAKFSGKYPAVVIPLLTQHYILLQRNLVYTGVTRGKKLVVLVGEPRALHMAIHNNKMQKRFTRLAERLQGSCSTTSSSITDGASEIPPHS